MNNIGFLSVVMLLGSVQWLTVTSMILADVSDPPPTADIVYNSPVEVMPNILTNKATNKLYQGDIVLTDEQWRALVSRKALKDIRTRWPKSADGTVTIDFRYADTIVNKTIIASGLSRLEQATCIKFNEIQAPVAKPHLIFITSTDACSSSLGQVYTQNGQNVNLAPSCFNGGFDGTVVHEVGHALGLYHEQSRSDRDDYLYIMLANVQTGMEHNFNKEDSNNYGLPYDYTSIMQYRPDSFSKNGLNTIVAKDPLAQPLIQDSQIMSFMDKKIVNLMYNCTDTWLAKCNKTTDPCQNQGYTKSDCTCDCPLGTSGANCETLSLPYIDALINAKSPGSQRITTPGTVTSPGYPTPVTTATTRVQSIVAPECNTVKLTFNAFNMEGQTTLTLNNGTTTTTYQACWFMILEIRRDDPPVTGTAYCGANITAAQTFLSVGRFMVLTFTSKDIPGNTQTGYNATVEFVPVTGNCTPNTTTTATTSTTTAKTSTTTATTSTTTATTSTTTATTPTTTAASSSDTLINSSITTGLCSLVPTANSSVYYYRSPNYPSDFGWGQRCTIWFNTTKPRYLKVTPLALKLGLFGSADLFYAYQTTTYLDASKEGTAIILPSSSSSRFTYQAFFLCPGGKFDIKIEVVNSDCHQLIQLDAGSNGTLSIPANYPAGTICEWWLRAPTGRKVQVSFTSFSIGQVFCMRDYVLIDLTGDSRYATRTTRYCGENSSSPGTVVSTGNALNILVNGKWGTNYLGLTATYKVV